MRESRTYGSVRGALRNERPYRDRQRHPGAMVQFARSVPDFVSLNPGYKTNYDPARFPFTPRLSTYSLPSIGAMCGGSRSR